MPTGREYAAEAEKIYRITPKPGYIYGTMNKLWTAADQVALERKYNSNPSKYKDYKLGAEIGSKWIGHRVWDCSGLTKDCGKRVGIDSYHHGSNSSYNYDCQAKGPKTVGMKLPVGAWVYTGTPSNRGHIGIVFDDDTVIEAQGTKSGVVKSSINLKKWTWWGLGKGLTFDFIPNGNTIKTPTATGSTSSAGSSLPSYKTYPTIRKGDRGELVVQLQRLLSSKGYDLEIDGIFGPITQNAVKSYQKKYGLTVDGIVGPQTWDQLLKRT